MSMIDDLNELSSKVHTLCMFQRIRLEDGEERYQEIVELLAANATEAKKQAVLEQYGYLVSTSHIGNHVRGLCRQCA